MHCKCAFPENIHTSLVPMDGIMVGFPRGEVRGSSRPKKLKEMYQDYMKFPEGWDVGLRKKIPSMGELWMFSVTIQYM